MLSNKLFHSGGECFDNVSSSGSTDSLTSILQHDSYQSGISSDEDPIVEPIVEEINPNSFIHHSTERRHIDREASFKRDLSQFNHHDEVKSSKKFSSMSHSRSSGHVIHEFVSPPDNVIGGGADPCYFHNTTPEMGYNTHGSNKQRIIARKPGYPGVKPRSFSASNFSLQNQSNLKKKPKNPQLQWKANASFNQTNMNYCGNLTPKTPIKSSMRRIKSAQMTRSLNEEKKPREFKTQSALETRRKLSRVRSRTPDSSRSLECHSTKSERSRSVDSVEIDKRAVSNDSELSAWDKWLIEKEKKKRIQAKREKEKRTEEQSKKQEEVMKKEAKQNRIKTEVERWKLKKEKMDKRQKSLQEKRERMKLEEKEQKELQTKAKAQEKYRQWMEEKKVQEEKRKKEEEELQNKKEAEHKQKLEKAEKAFEQWKEHTANRHLTPPYSYGYSDGKLTGYYDKTSNPMPSFINPKPWVPPTIPRENLNRKQLQKQISRKQLA